MVSLSKQLAENSLLLYRTQYMRAVHVGSNNFPMKKFLDLLHEKCLGDYNQWLMLKLPSKVSVMLFDSRCRPSFVTSNHNKHHPIFCH